MANDYLFIYLFIFYLEVEIYTIHMRTFFRRIERIWTSTKSEKETSMHQ